MECKGSLPRSSNLYKLSKSNGEETASNNHVRSSSSKSKRTRDDDYVENIIDMGPDHPSDSKNSLKIAAPSMKDEKENETRELRRLLSKAEIIEEIQEEKANNEFEEMLHRPTACSNFALPTYPVALKVLQGFKM